MLKWLNLRIEPWDMNRMVRWKQFRFRPFGSISLLLLVAKTKLMLEIRDKRFLILSMKTAERWDIYSLSHDRSLELSRRDIVKNMLGILRTASGYYMPVRCNRFVTFSSQNWIRNRMSHNIARFIHNHFSPSHF